ncbi:MAG: 4Fe-4S dicluster domain-containing protein [Chloroflexi bacterium]|nr:4Fe-4S dicluster domain-containing protein [Chloroflexota bacterium]
MVIDLERCAACQACAIACKMETNVASTTPETFRKRMMSFRSRVVPLVRGGSYPTPAVEPYPLLCNQCDNPPCVSACPTGATYRRDDGIILVDWDKCIGCRYCIAACPYDMRYLVLEEEAKDYQNPDLPRPARGKVDKCTFCAHLVDRGMEPACVTACPARARIFGDLNDPGSAVSRLLATRESSVLKPEFGTKPMVAYVK